MQDKANYYFVYEFCNGGDLEGFLAKMKKTHKCMGMSEHSSVPIFRMILNGFKDLVK